MMLELIWALTVSWLIVPKSKRKAVNSTALITASLVVRYLRAILELFVKTAFCSNFLQTGFL